MLARDQNPINIGDLAEDEFVKWCTFNGLLPTKANRDRMGWDYFVEFPAIQDSTRSPDDSNALIKTLCQIKATKNNSKNISIKLSALKQLVDADLPSYVIFMFYDKNSVIRSASILHIGPAVIEIILKKIVIAQSQRRATHETTMCLPMSEAHPLHVDGTNLAGEMRRHIVEKLADYIVRKDSVRNNCGYDPTSYKGRFSLSPEVAPSDFFDLFTGEKSSVHISNFSISKNRFGIEKLQENIGSCTLSIEPKPLQDVTLRLVNKEAHSSSEMSVSMYTAPFPNLPNELRKFRLKNEFVDIITNQGSENATIDVCIPNVPLPLSKLSNLVKFASLLGMKNTEAQLIAKNRIPQTFGSRLDVANEFKQWEPLSEFLQFISVALFKHRPHATMQMSIDEALACFRENTEAFSMISRPGLRVESIMNGNDVIPNRHSAILICPALIAFGDYNYYAIVEIPSVKFSIDRLRMRFTGERPRILDDGILEKDVPLSSVVNELIGRHNIARKKAKKAIISMTLNQDAA